MIPDETPRDSALDAAARRQAGWAEDAKTIFHGPTEEQKRRDEMLQEIDAMQMAQKAMIKKAEAEQAKAKEKLELAANLEAARLELVKLEEQRAKVEEFIKSADAPAKPEPKKAGK